MSDRSHMGYSWQFLRMNLANLLCLGGSMMFVLLPAYLEHNGLYRWEMGLSEGCFWLVSLFIQPWLGPRLDRYGRKTYLLGGTLLMGLMAASYVVIPVNIVPILLARVLQGVGFTLYLTASWTWVADHAPPERMGEMFGVFGISGLIAAAGGPRLAEEIHDSYDYRGVFLAGSAMIALALILCLTLTDRPPAPGKKTRLPSFAKLAWTVPMRGTTLGSIGFGLAFGCISAFAAAYLASLNLEGVGRLFAVTTIASAFSRVWAGRMTDRLGPSAMIIPSLIMLALGIFGLSNLTHSGKFVYLELAAIGFVAGLGYGIIYPALNALAVERLPESARGRGLSLVTASHDLGCTSGAALSGVLAQYLGYPRMFFVMGILVVANTFAYATAEADHVRRLRKREGKRRRTAAANPTESDPVESPVA